MLWSTPNLITYGRIAVIPILALLMVQIGPEHTAEHNACYSFWAMIVFAIAGISDLVDGYYARKYGEVSLLGKFFDPMADKLIHMTALVMLIPLGRLPAWFAVVLLFREIFVSGLRAAAAGEGLVIDAAQWGKWKTAWLNVGIAGVILYNPLFEGTAFQLNTYDASLVCLAIGFIFSVASAMQYTVAFFRRMKEVSVKR